MGVPIPRKQKHRFFEPKKQDFAYGLQLTVKVIVNVNVKVEQKKGLLHKKWL